MHADACTLAGRVESLNLRFTPLIGPDAAHLVMRAGAYRDRAFNWIDTGKFDGQLPNLREAFQDALTPQMAKIEQHTTIHAAPLENFFSDGERDRRARRQLHVFGSVVFHEP